MELGVLWDPAMEAKCPWGLIEILFKLHPLGSALAQANGTYFELR